MGAKTVMAVALRKRVKIGNLIPVDNAPVDAALKSDFATYVVGMRKIEEAGVKSLRDADKILQPYEESVPIRQFLLTNLMRTEEGTQKFRVPLEYLTKALGKLGDFPFNDPDETRFEGPTLFVRGTQSHYIADNMLPICGRFFPKFELASIDAGHWVISEKPEEFRQGECKLSKSKCHVLIWKQLWWNFSQTENEQVHLWYGSSATSPLTSK